MTYIFGSNSQHEALPVGQLKRTFQQNAHIYVGMKNITTFVDKIFKTKGFTTQKKDQKPKGFISKIIRETETIS